MNWLVKLRTRSSAKVKMLQEKTIEMFQEFWVVSEGLHEECEVFREINKQAQLTTEHNQVSSPKIGPRIRRLYSRTTGEFQFNKNRNQRSPKNGTWLRNITRENEYEINFWSMWLDCVHFRLRLKLSIRDNRFVMGSFLELHSLKSFELNQVDSGINIFGHSSQIIALLKLLDVFEVDIFGIARVRFCSIWNIEKQISLFVLSEECIL